MMVAVSHSRSERGRAGLCSLHAASPASCYLILYQLWLHVGCRCLPISTREALLQSLLSPLHHHTWHGMSAELSLLALVFFNWVLMTGLCWFAKLAAATTDVSQSPGQVDDWIFIGVVK